MIELQTLGGLDLRDAKGRELRAVLRQPKRFALLAYLAVATPRGFHRRDTLLGLFWPELNQKHARNALNQAVHVLRHSLGREPLSPAVRSLACAREQSPVTRTSWSERSIKMSPSRRSSCTRVTSCPASSYRTPP